MKYKAETIERYTEKARNAVQLAKSNLSNCHVRVSYGNKKIGKTLNFNLLAILTCGGMCKKCGCQFYCYAVKDCLRFPAVLRSRAINTALALYDTERYFAEIAEIIERRKSYEFIRFHVSGELIGVDYFAEMVKLAKRFQNRRFWTYTKQYEIVNSYIAKYGELPKNFVVMFSDWDGYAMINPYTMPTFRFYPAEKWGLIPASAFVCGGDCNYCKANKCGCVYGQSAIVKEH